MAVGSCNGDAIVAARARIARATSRSSSSRSRLTKQAASPAGPGGMSRIDRSRPASERVSGETRQLAFHPLAKAGVVRFVRHDDVDGAERPEPPEKIEIGRPESAWIEWSIAHGNH